MLKRHAWRLDSRLRRKNATVESLERITSAVLFIRMFFPVPNFSEEQLEEDFSADDACRMQAMYAAEQRLHDKGIVRLVFMLRFSLNLFGLMPATELNATELNAGIAFLSYFFFLSFLPMSYVLLVEWKYMKVSNNYMLGNLSVS